MNLQIRRGTEGHSLLEILIASVILAIVAVVTYSFLGTTMRICDDSALEAGLDSSARLAIEEMSREIRLADSATLSVSTYRGSDRVEFRMPTKYTADGVVWGPYIQYRFEDSVGKAKGPGKSDGGRLVRMENDQSRTLCDDLPRGAISFKLAGKNFQIKLHLRSTDGRGRPIATTAETSVTLRNRSDR